ncbi:hypothetical protein ACA30_09530 [Virgibacillus soli]|uniref:Uncharacterized protein n=1 Tax=Lederbergia galactosidilytica TaxID=217031 RepID=A0A0Q9Y7T8_9BACI|nr:hypothetical protein ACA30_09530 [Virgibacillus soli]KRG16912.1 hypothetical protein ACA29_02245 [Lederbergia galactosidilytica]
MDKSLSFGIFTVIVAFVIGFVTHNWMLVLKIAGGVTLVVLLLAGLFTARWQEESASAPLMRGN